MFKRVWIFLMCIAMLATATGCNKSNSKINTNTNATEGDSEEETKEAVKLTDVSQMAEFVVEYTSSDNVPEWENNNTQIKLNGDSVEVAGEGASYKDSVITISKGGNYLISGQLNDGKIVISTDKQDKVYLILNSVNIASSDDAVINETSADKVIITLPEGTDNTLSDASKHSDENITAAIYCKDSLTINGTGKLTVNGNYNDAITSKDKLKIIDAVVNIVSADDGIVGKDLAAVKSGTLTIDSTGDGIKSTDTTDTAKGIVCVDGGTIIINSELDAIQADNFVRINGGVISLSSGGGSVNESSMNSDANVPDNNANTLSGNREAQVSLLTEKDMQPPANGDMPQGGDGQMQPPNGGQMPDKNMNPGEMPTDENGNMQKMEMPTDENGNMQKMEIPADENGDIQRGGKRPDNQKGQGGWGKWGNEEMEGNSSSGEETPSAKGIKGGNGIYIKDGTINIDSSDDALHSNDMVYILGGVISTSSGDDGIHADTTVDISGGTIGITKSYEGIEACYITISGGDVTLEARDDGFNAAGGNDGSSVNGRQGQNRFNEEVSDASITIKGGSVSVTASGDGIDSNGSIMMIGGTLVVCGPQSGGNGILDYGSTFTMDGGTLLGAGTSGMFMSTSSTSKLNVINANISGNSGDNISIYDGNEKLAEFTANTNYQAVVISMDKLEEGKSYTIKYGNSETTAEAGKAVDYSGM